MMFGSMATAADWSKKVGTALIPGGLLETRQTHSGDPASKLTGWATLAMTLRGQGMETVWRVPYDSALPGAKLLGGIAPIDKKLYSRLPSGPYGFLACAQPGAYYEAKDDSLHLTPEQKKSTDDALNAFEKETGLNIRKDIVTGLKGNLTLAVYPGREAMTGMPDGLILLDDANGSDPVTMAEKVKAAIIAECKKNHSAAPQFDSVQRAGAVVWTVDEKSQAILRQGSGLEPRTDPRMQFGGNGNVAAASAPEKKQLLFATMGRSVVITSSNSLLNRAIASYNTGTSTLETDPAYMSLLKQLTPGAQNVLVLAVPDVLERLKPLMAQQFSSPQGPRAADYMKVFGSRGNGLVISQGHEGQTLTGSIFFPIDYEAAIHLAGLAGQKKRAH